MIQHWRVERQRQNLRGRGRPRLNLQESVEGEANARPEQLWRENVPCQRFFLSRAASSWFEVNRRTAPWKSKRSEAEAAKGTPCKLNPETQSHIQAVIERHERYTEAQDQPRCYAKALGEETHAATSPWLERTQWLKMFKNTRRDILRMMIRLYQSYSFSQLVRALRGLRSCTSV
jgi:hypothetical protein